jgi:spermidine synthase
MLVVNLWGGDRLFETLVQRIESAFPGGTLCLPAERPGNVIVFGFRGNPGPIEWNVLHGRAQLLEKAFRGLEFPRFVEALGKMNRRDERFLYATRARTMKARTGFP